MNTGTLETGISDHHFLVYTMLKITYDKRPPKVVKYRQWKHFNQDLFKLELGNLLNRNNYTNVTEYYNFEKIFCKHSGKTCPVENKIQESDKILFWREK